MTVNSKLNKFLKYFSAVIIVFIFHIIFISAYEAHLVNIVATIKDNTPQAFPQGGVYNGPISITLVSSEPGASIYYTLDGENPSCDPFGNLYSGAINIEDDTIVKAVACGPNNSKSGLMSEFYDIEMAPPTTLTSQVVINEVMWMGSTVSTADEWIELRNLTNSSIDLTGWIIERAAEGSSSIVLEGSIPANGFYLISNYNSTSTSSALADSVEADMVMTGLSLNNSGEKLILKDAVGTIIDQTPTTTDSWPAGSNLSEIKQSMSRNDPPGDGSLAENWHTCSQDSCRSTIYWDSEGGNYGTPKANNL